MRCAQARKFQRPNEDTDTTTTTTTTATTKATTTRRSSRRRRQTEEPAGSVGKLRGDETQGCKKKQQENGPEKSIKEAKLF